MYCVDELQLVTAIRSREADQIGDICMFPRQTIGRSIRLTRSVFARSLSAAPADNWRSFYAMPPLNQKISSCRFLFRRTAYSDSSSISSISNGLTGARRTGLGRKMTARNCTPDPKAASPSIREQVREHDGDLESRLCLQPKESTLTIMNGARLNGNESNHGRPAASEVVIAVDVDEVLGNFVSALNNFIRDRYGGSYSVSEYHVYEFYKIWNCSRDEANFRVHEFFKTPYFKNGIHPIPGAQKALLKLSSLCKLSVVTSRQHVIKDHTIQWIENHFPGMFQDIHFGNHFALAGESKPKSEICKSLGAKVLIDDNPSYAIECAEVGIRAMLFDFENKYPWCKSDRAIQHPLVTKVYNWEQVEQELVPLVVSDSVAN